MNPLDNLLLTFELIRNTLHFSVLKASALVVVSVAWVRESSSVFVFKRKSTEEFFENEMDLMQG